MLKYSKSYFLKNYSFYNMRCFVMFITSVCLLLHIMLIRLFFYILILKNSTKARAAIKL